MSTFVGCNNFTNLSLPHSVYCRWEYQKYAISEDIEWKIIPGHPNYEISSSSLVRHNHNKSYSSKRKILVQTLRNNKYFYVTLTGENGKRVGYPVDKLMVMTFHKLPKNKIRKVIHHDFIKHNNQLKNLYYLLW